ncbi:MAG: GNAT family N-acetyltransferase [Hyphomonas sp.]
MRLRAPRIDELSMLSDFCLRSKAVWGYDPGMLARFRTELTLSEADVRENPIVVADDLRGVAGMVEVSFDEDIAVLEKLFVEPGRLGEGTGNLMYVWACRMAQGRGARELIIDADPGAAAFYERMGAEPAGESESGSLPGRFLPRLVHQLHPASKE